MNQGRYIFSQICEFLPKRVFDRLVDKYKGNKYIKSRDGRITFSSSDERVVKVNAETGELTVVGTGTAIISVSGAETDYRLAPAMRTYTVIIAEATGVAETAYGKAANDRHFDLQGRRANPKDERNGIYVVNGKKVVKR